MAIEKSFGILKRRFPALRNGLRLKKITDNLLLITCAFIFYNICIIQKDLTNFEDEEHVEEIDHSIFADSAFDRDGEEARRRMINEMI